MKLAIGVAGVVGLVTLATACGSPATYCGLVGTRGSGVDISVVGPGIPLGPSVSARVCINGRCSTSRDNSDVKGISTSGQGYVVDQSLAGKTSARVDVTLYRHGTTVYSGSKMVELQREDVNGAGCGPIIWHGQYTNGAPLGSR